MGREAKGKTTAAIGLSIRAAGQGFQVLFMQFLKDDSSGEISVLRTVPEITVCHSPVHYGFTFQMTEEQKSRTAKEYNAMLEQAISSNASVIVLDEVLHALNVGMIQKDKLEKLLLKDCEIVLTGRDAPKWLVECADYLSEIREIKHPYKLGVQARKGIEY